MKKKINFNTRTLFALPYFVFMLVFVVVPLVMLIISAFNNNGQGFSFTEVANFFSDSSQWATIGRSLRIALAASLTCILVGYPLAYLIAKMKSHTAQYLTLMALIAPMWINGLLRTVALKDFATWLGIPVGETLLTLGLTFDYLPFMIMPIFLVLTGINQQYFEVSADLGASPLITFTKVVLPLSLPGVISGFLMVFTPAVSTYYMAEYLGDQSTYMIGEQLNTMFTKDNKSGAAVIALVLLALVAISVVVAQLLTRLANGNRRLRRRGVR